MKPLFVITRSRGKAWNPGQNMRDQLRWDEHARFMEGLAAAGFVVMGGPIGEEGDILLLIDAPDEKSIRDRLAADPWSQMDLLVIRQIQRWTVLLNAQK